MDATQIVFNGTFIARLNDWQDEYEYDGVRYAVEETYGGPEFGTKYYARAI